MGRKILAVICSFAAMYVLIFLTFSGAYMVIGMERTYLPGTYETGSLWNMVSLILGALAAGMAGWMCFRISRNVNTVRVLAAVILILGLIQAGSVMASPPSREARTESMDAIAAMGKTVTPLWLALLNPVVGAVFALMGGRVAEPKDSPG